MLLYLSCEKEFTVNFLFFNAVLNPNRPKALQLPLIFLGVVVRPPVCSLYTVLLLMLFCVVGKKELVHLKEKIDEIDENAFVIVGDAREVHGEGFIEK